MSAIYNQVYWPVFDRLQDKIRGKSSYLVYSQIWEEVQRKVGNISIAVNIQIMDQLKQKSGV